MQADQPEYGEESSPPQQILTYHPDGQVAQQHDAMYVVPVMARAAKAKPISTATGTASTAHGECTRPIVSMTSVNAAA